MNLPRTVWQGFAEIPFYASRRRTPASSAFLDSALSVNLKRLQDIAVHAGGFSGGAYRKLIADQRARFVLRTCSCAPSGWRRVIVAAMLAVLSPHEAGRRVRQENGD